MCNEWKTIKSIFSQRKLRPKLISSHLCFQCRVSNHLTSRRYLNCTQRLNTKPLNIALTSTLYQSLPPANFSVVIPNDSNWNQFLTSLFCTFYFKDRRMGCMIVFEITNNRFCDLYVGMNHCEVPLMFIRRI